MFLTTCLLLICLLVRDVTAGGIYPLTNEERREILNAHNHFRRLTTTATDMRLMRWHCGLEEYAVNYLKRCQFEHSPKPDRRNLEGFWSVGENLLWKATSAVGEELPNNLTLALKGFYDEIKYYRYSDGSCSKKPCGHYTQVVWAESYALGCALTRCTEGLKAPYRSQVIMSCVYGPGGNILGQKPYKKNGAKCSGCVSREGHIAWGNHCVNGLCNDTPQPPALPQCTCTKHQPRCIFSSASRPAWAKAVVLTLSCLTVLRASWLTL